MVCIFCGLKPEVIVSESLYFNAVWDIDPIQEGHLLLISKKHKRNLASLSEKERLDLLAFQERLIAYLEKHTTILGITVVMNNGQLMDEGTHFHCHLIPRYSGDGFWDNVRPQNHPFPSNLQLPYGLSDDVKDKLDLKKEPSTGF